MRTISILAVFVLTGTALTDTFTTKENLRGGATVFDQHGTIVLEGRPNLRGGEDYRDLSGQIRATTRPSLSSEQIEVDRDEGSED